MHKHVLYWNSWKWCRYRYGIWKMLLVMEYARNPSNYCLISHSNNANLKPISMARN